MYWYVDWKPATTEDAKRIGLARATSICTAVIRHAKTGEGTVRDLAGNPHRSWLAAPGAVALLGIDRETRTITVWRLFRVD